MQTRSKKKAAAPPKMDIERILSLPQELQIEILSYLDLDSQMAASEAHGAWADLLLSSHATQSPRRFSELHAKTGFRDLSVFLDSGRRGWYVKTSCEYGDVYTYFYIQDNGRALNRDQNGRLIVPDINAGRDISNCPLLDDRIIPLKEFNAPIPPKTTVTSSGEIEFSRSVRRAGRWKTLKPFFILFDNQVEDSGRPVSHRLEDWRVRSWKEKCITFSVYRNARVSDFVQVGLDMLWDLKRTTGEWLWIPDRYSCPGPGQVYQVFVEF
ncbi:hypothetical protein TWF481_007576 [Arthrobotrys musiformis]|uniref:F-box domain-containing protein n=1 Tax=Arthrobotrys musiformis TaxID=47236 RepID=A0AAV9WDF8_9PEZI